MEMTSNKKGRFLVHFRGEQTSDSTSQDPATEVTPSLHSDTSVKDKSRRNLYLYDEDMKSMPRTVTFLDTFNLHLDSHVTYPSAESEKKAAMLSHKSKLGTMLGVYLPTIQHIMGLLMFIRHSWIVGHCGLLESLLMVSICCLTTFFTAISVSAIATNGILQSGGSYYVLSRNLGPECGGSIGICFYLANTFATCMYLLGSIELFLVYMAPDLAIFGDIHHNPWNNYRFYGTCLLILLTVLVAFGVKIVQLFAPLSLVCVIVSIVSIVVGSLASHPDYKDVKVCLLGEKLYAYPTKWINSPGNANFSANWCSKNESSYLYQKLCKENNSTVVCDPYFMSSDVRYVPAIPGITSGVIKDNLFSHYLQEGEVSQGIPGNRANGEVISDISSNFIILCAIYFPSVTGILTGVNMSGDLKDPQKSIPKGTILAQLSCSVVYILLIIFYGATVRGEVLRDKFGESLGSELISALLCWPNKWVVLVGAFASSLGAGLQCLVSAPRLLQAIARDDIIPFLSIFKTLTKRGEPIRALILTFFIAEVGILIANIDAVAPIIDVFFLMCYLFVNLICVLQTILKLPNWRPRFKYYHWSLSLLGAALNFALCIIAGWYYALSAFAVAAFILLYIQYKGGEKEWGDGMTGLLMSFTERALLHLGNETHTKNWRPQILVLDAIDLSTNKVKHPELLRLVGQLKHGRGLTIMGSVLEGDPHKTCENVTQAVTHLREELAEQKIKGFVKIVRSPNLNQGLSLLIQALGIGGMTHNTVMLAWPSLRSTTDQHGFIDLVRIVRDQHLALLVLKTTNFPLKSERLSGTIDIWWIIHDGGMLILLSFLLQQHKVWRGCKIRIFTVAHVNDNSIQIKTQLESYLYEIRIEAEVFVEEMFDSDISAFEVERTLDMESRVEVMRKAADRKFSKATNTSKSSRQSETLKADVLKFIEKTPEKKTSTKDFAVQAVVDPTIVVDSTAVADPTPVVDSNHISDPTHVVVPTPTHQESDSNQNAITREDSVSEGLFMKPTEDPDADEENDQLGSPVHFTFSPGQAAKLLKGKNFLAVSQYMRMHNAMQLNKVLISKSNEAELIIINLPAPPAKLNAEENYISYLEMLSNGLQRVLFVRGSGKEVVTVYS